MFHQTPERQMHLVRWVLTFAWLLLIATIFYDPISSQLTHPTNTWSPLRIDPNLCIKVQGVCLEAKPYPLGAAIFWGLVMPSSIFILFVFGHELWRRICPLSFLSQIPRALGWQRLRQRIDKKSGRVRLELVKVSPSSWLGRNHLYLQFAWLFVGLCGRILLFNSDHLFLPLWLLGNIVAAILIGYLYRGKSWCHYFCPMGSVQRIYGEPAGLFTSKAHMSDRSLTQSTCRTVDENGQEQNACVACNPICFDIDSERSYWENITHPQQKFIYYSYIGLVIGYFTYYYLYAGNWDYYFSGAWTRDANQLNDLFKPGFYLFEHSINIPKLVAVPLTLSTTTFVSYSCGRMIEKKYRAYVRRKGLPLSSEVIQHRIFTLCTFGIFNFFFIFGGRPFIVLLPDILQIFYNALLLILSILWLCRTWSRSPDLYIQEIQSRPRKKLISSSANQALALKR